MSVSVSTAIELDGLYSLWDPKNTKCLNAPRTETVGGFNMIDLGGKANLFINGLPSLNDLGYLSFRQDQTIDYLSTFNYTVPLTAFSFNVWFRSKFTQDGQTVISYSISGERELVLQLNGRTSIKPYILQYSDFQIPTTDMKDKWVNLCWTRDTTTGRNRFYRDGDLLAEISRDSLTAPRTAGDFIIGQFAGPGTPIESTFSADFNLDGDFGYLAVYDKELSSDSVKKNYHAVRTRFGA